jgi:hypothetical protein
MSSIVANLFIMDHIGKLSNKLRFNSVKIEL